MKMLFIVLLCIHSYPVFAEVVDSAETGFTVKNMIVVKTDSGNVFRSLVKDIDQWWSPDHTFSGKSENLRIDAKAGGCFCEKLDGGGSVRHMEVVFVKPGKMLRMTGALGPLQSLGVSGSMTFLLYSTSEGTAVELTYSVGGYVPGGLQNWASPVDQVLILQLTRLKNFIEAGKPDDR